MSISLFLVSLQNHYFSGSGGNLDNLIDKPFMGTFPSSNILIIGFLPNKMNKIATTTRDQTV